MSFQNSLLVLFALPLIPASPLAAQPDCLVVPITNNGGNSFRPSVDGAFVAFASDSDLTGGNPDLNQEIFLWDGATITQITDTTSGSSVDPSLDGGSIAFSSNADFTGGNPDGTYEIYYFDGASLQQVTSQPVGGAIEASLDGMNLAYAANSNPQGEGDLQVFAASCLPDPVPEDVPAGGALALITLALFVALAGVTVLRR